MQAKMQCTGHKFMSICPICPQYYRQLATAISTVRSPPRLPVVISAGDSDGKLYLFDPRVGSSSSNGSSSIVSSLQVHKAGSKVNSISVNPAGGSNCVLTAGKISVTICFESSQCCSCSSIWTQRLCLLSTIQPWLSCVLLFSLKM